MRSRFLLLPAVLVVALGVTIAGIAVARGPSAQPAPKAGATPAPQPAAAPAMDAGAVSGHCGRCRHARPSGTSAPADGTASRCPCAHGDCPHCGQGDCPNCGHGDCPNCGKGQCPNCGKGDCPNCKKHAGAQKDPTSE
jgi:hypothetical protein